MHTRSIEYWLREHTFGHDRRKPGEARTLAVLVITAITMVLEVMGGIFFGSMALLADGIHMGSHAMAVGISFFAYIYTRRHARDRRFSFGAGKVASLAGYTGALLLVLFALLMAGESVRRLVFPISIGFNGAILVAFLGLLVNGVCLLILGGGGDKHGHGEEDHPHPHGGRGDAKTGAHHHHHEDHSLLSAYLHVLADLLTSVLAIAALLAGKYLGWLWLDPVTGIAGALLIIRWSRQLAGASAGVLLDMEAPAAWRRAVRRAIEADADNRVSDLHIRPIGQGIYAAEIALVTARPRPPEHYLSLIPRHLSIEHSTVQVFRCRRFPAPRRRSKAR